MRITPQSEQAVMEAGLLPAGDYPFSIVSADEKLSKNNNPMIVAKLEAYDADGRAHNVTDYLMESVAYKLRHFAYAVGLGNRYEAGELSPAELSGLSGRCSIRIEPAKDGYSARNSVKDYVKRDDAAPVVAAAPRIPTDSVQDPNQPPF